jgi:hypothetical protein
MTDYSKPLPLYFAIWCVTILMAAAGTLWLGLDARIPVDIAANGVVLKTRSVAVLWFAPAMTAFLYGSLALGGWIDARRRRRRKPVELGEDALRGLEAFGRAIRNVMVGFGLLLILMELFTLLRAGGITTPLGLDREGVVRLVSLVAGALFAYSGNVIPKLPWMSRPGLDTSAFYRANRLVGWIFMLGGLGYVLSALTLPFNEMTRINGLLVLAMLGLSALCYLGATVSSWRRIKAAPGEGAR